MIRSLKALDEIADRWELLIVDDGSTDATYALAKEYEGDHRGCTVRVLTKPNGGKWSAHNYRLARPHAGLDAADAVIEVNVEGITRFIALFHSSTPPTIGPVRSARTTDLDLLAAEGIPSAIVSSSKNAVPVLRRAFRAGEVLVDEIRRGKGLVG